MKKGRKQNGILPQKMTAVLLSAVLIAGLISNAMPVNVLAQENIGRSDAVDQAPVEGDGVSGNVAGIDEAPAPEEETPQDVTYTAGAAYVAEDSPQAQTAEVSYSTDGGQTWVDVDEFINVFFSAYMTKDNTILRLNTDIIVSQSVLPVMSGRHTTIDGQGHTISRGSYAGQLFTIGEPGHVTFKNITIDGGAVWDNAENVHGRSNSGFSGGGSQNMIYICNSNASVTLDDGAILQNNALNKSRYNGAAVMIEEGALIMNSGAVIRNNSAVGTTDDWGGGGAAVGINNPACAFTMNGGEIYGNYASVAGGAVCNFGTFTFNGGKIYKNASGNHGGAVVNDSGTMIMAGGEITQNVAVAGGGISGKNAPQLSVKGGIIHHNTAFNIAGGINANGAIDLSGIPQIKDNTANGDTDNLYLTEGEKVTISGALNEGAVIGVTTEAAPAAETPVEITGENNADYSGYFISDNANYKIENKTGNIVQLIGKSGSGGDDNDKGQIITDIEKGENAPAVGISTSEKQLEDMLLTDSEKQQVETGTDIKIILNVQDAGDTVSPSDRSAAETALNDYSMGQYLDISLYKLVGEHRTDITETKKKITITIAVPDALKNTDSNKTRNFAIIRVHDGKVEILNDLDNSEDTITIETDRFSTYAIIYKDAAGGSGTGDSDNGSGGNDNDHNGGNSSSDNNNNNGNGNNSSNDNSSSNSGNNNNSNASNANGGNGSGGNNSNTVKNNGSKADGSKDKEPNTGDFAPIECYATLSMIAGFAYLLLYFGDSKRGMSEETKKELVTGLIGWAKKGGKIRKLLAIAAIFLLLVYYHSIGKKTCVEWEEVYGK